MAERRPFPPSPRRLALARQTGLTAASPFLVGALACGAAIVAAILLARGAAARLGMWIAAACDGSASLAVRDLPRAVLELAGPLVVAAAAVAIAAHVVQTRAFWLPRRRVPGAPVVENGPGARTARSAFEMTAAAIIGVVAVGWLWSTAPRLAQLVELEPHSAPLSAAAMTAPAPAATPTAPVRAATPKVATTAAPSTAFTEPSALNSPFASGVGSAIAALVVALAIAWLLLAVIDALLRRAQLQRALAMTTTEKRDDDRLAAADPRWRAHRAALAKGPTVADAVARAAVVILGDDTAVAIAWDPTRQPVPLRTATGRRARATQILALARRHRIAVHRDVQLAAALVDGEGLVPDHHWRQLADVIAAVGSRRAA